MITINIHVLVLYLRWGSDCSPLSHPCKAPGEILCPSLGNPTKDRYGAFGKGPREGYEDDLRAGTPLL